MKKTLVIMLCAVLMFISLPSALPAAVYAAADGSEDWGGYESTVVSTMGEFEGVTESTLTAGGWTLTSAELVSGAGDAYAGTGYIKIAAGGSLGFSVDSEPDSAYLLQGYYKYVADVSAGGAQLYMQEDDVNRYTNYNSALVHTTAWTRFGMAMIANKTKTGEVSFAIKNPAGAASLYLDNVKLIRLFGYDTRNLIQNQSFEFNDLDTSTTQHHYASWYNNGNVTLVGDAHTGDKALRVNSGNIYTYAFLPDTNTAGKRYELSAWVKWANGTSFANGMAGLTAPSIGVESYAGSTQLQTKNYYFTVESGIKSNDWCHVRLLLDEEATQTTLTHFRLFLFSGTGTTVWDDISVKPVETYMDVVNNKYEVQNALERDKTASYTLRAQYLGAEGEADGKAYFAQYKYDSQSDLILENIASMAVSADGRTSECTLGSVNTAGDDATFVKAYLWDSKMNPVDTLVLEEYVPKANIIQNGGFEDVADGVPVGITPSHTWGGDNIALVTDEVYSGNYALKLTSGNYDVYFDFNLPDMFYGTTYTLSFMYKGTVTSDVTASNYENILGVTAFTRYHADTDSTIYYNRAFYAPSAYSADDWTEFTYTFRLLEGSELLVRPALRSRNSTIYIDDVTLTVADGSPIARVNTDQVFYYSELTGNGEAEIQLSPHFAGLGYTADVRLADGETVIKSAEGLSLSDNKAVFTYDLTLLAVKTKEYKVIADIKDAKGGTVYTAEQKIYKYDRPSTVSKDGTFTDINGKVINPVFAYHIAQEDFETAASAGINVVQYQVNTDVNVTLAELDEMYEMGVYAAIVSYWGMAPAGHSVNYERVSAYIKQIAHHPAIFCYMVMDEPFLNNPEAHEDLRNSYIMLRTADPARPTYICEGFPSFMKDVAKYCDIMAPDPYPTGVRGDMATYVTDMVTYADTYVNSNKPLITILQAFTQSGRRPTALELHSMMYQSFLAGSDAPGFYTWAADYPDVDPDMHEGDYWPMMQKFYKEEHEIVFNYYQSHKGEVFNYSKKADDKVWYESWRDGDYIYMVVQNRDESNDVTAQIPLVSTDEGTTISAYDVEPLGFGAAAAKISDKKAGGFTVTLQACAAVLLKIDTTAALDNGYSETTISVGGDFEYDLESILTKSGWTFPEDALVTDAADAHGGSGYIKLAAGSSLKFAVDNLADSAYLLTGYYKHGTDADTAGSQVFMTESDVNRSANYNNTLIYTNEWTKFGMVLNANKTQTGQISLEIRNTSGATLYLDNMALVRLDGHDTQNLIANPGFEYADADADSTAQHHYASWFNNGTLRLVNEAHTGNRGMKVVSGNAYTWAFLPDANPDGQKYELSAWVKWENGDAFVNGTEGLTAPYIGVESYADATRVAAKNYSFAVDSGITGSDWCKVSLVLDDESTPADITSFRIFLFSGTGETIWDDISVKPVQ